MLSRSLSDCQSANAISCLCYIGACIYGCFGQKPKIMWTSENILLKRVTHQPSKNNNSNDNMKMTPLWYCLLPLCTPQAVNSSLSDLISERMGGRGAFQKETFEKRKLSSTTRNHQSTQLDTVWIVSIKLLFLCSVSWHYWQVAFPIRLYWTLAKYVKL